MLSHRRALLGKYCIRLHDMRDTLTMLCHSRCSLIIATQSSDSHCRRIKHATISPNLELHNTLFKTFSIYSILSAPVKTYPNEHVPGYV